MLCPVVYIIRLVFVLLALPIAIVCGLLWAAAAAMKEDWIVAYPELWRIFIDTLHGKSLK